MIYAKETGYWYDHVNGGADTLDKLFLLSLEEVIAYSGYSMFADYYDDSTDKTMAVPTQYAVAQGADQSDYFKLDDIGCCQWWLRSPGIYTDSASIVDSDGILYLCGVTYTGTAVRPAFWLDLEFADIFV